MSRHDFSQDEFDDRRARVRAVMREQSLQWLVLFHPVSIHWLTGSDAKSYQEFQCLLFPALPGPLTMLTREGERCEFEMDALVDSVPAGAQGLMLQPFWSPGVKVPGPIRQRRTQRCSIS